MWVWAEWGCGCIHRMVNLFFYVCIVRTKIRKSNTIHIAYLNDIKNTASLNTTQPKKLFGRYTNVHIVENYCVSFKDSIWIRIRIFIFISTLSGVAEFEEACASSLQHNSTCPIIMITLMQCAKSGNVHFASLFSSVLGINFLLDSISSSHSKQLIDFR